jgi:hypothetical protein
MRAPQPKRSLLVTTLALIFLCWGSLVLVSVVVHQAWDPNARFWDHSDVAWEHEEVGGPPNELPIKGALTAWSLITFVAAVLFIGVPDPVEIER